jgi:hypothetical protein
MLPFASIWHPIDIRANLAALLSSHHGIYFSAASFRRSVIAQWMRQSARELNPWPEMAHAVAATARHSK